MHTDCACGAPVAIRKTGECRRCYGRRWHAEHSRRNEPQRPCHSCCKRPAVAGVDLCLSCLRLSRRPALHEKPCSYHAAHDRLKAARGPASNWRCVECGKRARHWAFVSGSLYEQRGPVHRPGRPDCVMSWSPNPADYRPLCISCHVAERRSDDPATHRRDDAERARAARRRHYANQTATDTGREAYRSRKRAEAFRRSTTRQARAWAVGQGLAVSPRGPLPSAVLAAWQAAGCPTTPRPIFASEQRQSILDD